MIEELKEKCGIVGIYGVNLPVSRLAFFALFALQHRGQEASGITTSDGKKLHTHKGAGLVAQAYKERDIENLTGYIGIGHNRYSTSKGGALDHAQPVVNIENSFALAHTVEYFVIPDDVLVICLGKSTYARTGIVVNVTPLEPGWEGHVTLEFSNTTPLPAKIYANEGCAQFLFFQSDERCATTYAERGGKYQGQQGVTLPKV